MIVDRRLRYAALIRVLRTACLGDAVLNGDELARQWRGTTGLRLADLDSAVHDMVGRGFVNVRREAGSRCACYELTAAGRSELLWQGALLSARDWVVLLGARTRGWRDLLLRRAPAPPAAERRQGGPDRAVHGVSVP